MIDTSSDHLTREDREALRAMMALLPAMIDLADAHGCEGARHWLDLAREELERKLAEAGGLRDH